jgi:hypothetical protein
VVSYSDIQVEGVEQHQLGHNDSATLKVDGLPGIMTQILDLQHSRVDELGDLRHCPFKVGEEGRVVERPF